MVFWNYNYFFMCIVYYVGDGMSLLFEFANHIPSIVGFFALTGAIYRWVLNGGTK